MKFIADLLKEVTAKGLDVAAMLLSRTSKFLAGLQPPTFLAGLQQPTSNLIQKSSKNGSGSNLFSTAPALCINKHPDVIRGKVTGHPTIIVLMYYTSALFCEYIFVILFVILCAMS